MAFLIIDVSGYPSFKEGLFYPREFAWAIVKVASESDSSNNFPIYWGATYYYDGPSPISAINLGDSKISYLRDHVHGLPLQPLNYGEEFKRLSSDLFFEMKVVYEMAMTVSESVNTAVSIALAASNVPFMTRSTVQLITCGKEIGETTAQLFGLAITNMPKPMAETSLPVINRGPPPCQFHSRPDKSFNMRCSISEVLKRIGVCNITSIKNTVRLNAWRPNLLSPSITVESFRSKSDSEISGAFADLYK